MDRAENYTDNIQYAHKAPYLETGTYGQVASFAAAEDEELLSDAQLDLLQTFDNSTSAAIMRDESPLSRDIDEGCSSFMGNNSNSSKTSEGAPCGFSNQ